MEEKKEAVQWANPAPAAVICLLLATFPLSALYLGWIPHEAMPALAPWFVMAGLIQLICGVILFKRGEFLLATVIIVFGGIIQFTNGFATCFAIWQHLPTTGAAGYGVGVIWLVLAAVVAIFVPPFATRSWSLCAIIIEVDVAVWLLGLRLLGVLTGIGSERAIGVLVFIFSLYMFYFVAAGIINEHFKRPILKLGGPILKR